MLVRVLSNRFGVGRPLLVRALGGTGVIAIAPTGCILAARHDSSGKAGTKCETRSDGQENQRSVSSANHKQDEAATKADCIDCQEGELAW